MADVARLAGVSSQTVSRVSNGQPGVVASTKGWWPGDAKGGATVNATVDERDSDMGGGAVYHDNRVRVEHAADSRTRIGVRVSAAEAETGSAVAFSAR